MPAVIRIHLRKQMAAFEKRTRQPMSYDKLATLTGLSRATLESLGSRETYNPRLSTIAQICAALDCKLDELLELTTD